MTVKKVLMILVWAFVLDLAFGFVVAAVAGGIAGAKNPENAAEAGRVAGPAAVVQLRIPIALAALGAAIAGGLTEKLPGTRTADRPVEKPRRRRKRVRTTLEGDDDQ